jgi:hypothetical protein
MDKPLDCSCLLKAKRRASALELNSFKSLASTTKLVKSGAVKALRLSLKRLKTSSASEWVILTGRENVFILELHS